MCVLFVFSWCTPDNGPIVSWDEYTRSIHMLLAGLGKGINVDFTKRKLVGIGHSMGAVALYVYSSCFYAMLFKLLAVFS